MHRLTRSLSAGNSPESRPVIVTPLLRRRHPTARFPGGSSFAISCRHTPRRQFSASPNPNKASSFPSTSVGHRISLAMDLDGPHPPEPDNSSTAASASAAAVEDFVHVEDTSPNRHNLEAIVVSMDEEVDDASTIATGKVDDDPIPSPDVHSLEGSVASVDFDRGADESENRGVEDAQRKVLPEELSRRVMKLSCESSAEGGNCDIYLVGTAHVSAESCQEVQAVVNCLKPQVVFLELCSSRVAALTLQNLKVPTLGEMIDMWKKKHNLFGILYSWFLAKVAGKLEVLPGAEFRVAYDEAMKYGGKVILGDRPVQITLKRTWAKMPLWHKTKLIYSLLFQAFFLPSAEDLNKMLKEMDDVDMLTLVIQEMSKEFPTLMETLVHERDLYMSYTLHRVASEHSSVVAVVGKGHLQGIKRNWKQPVEVEDLLEMPSKKSAILVVKVLKSLGFAAAGVALVSGIYISCKK